MKTVDEMLGEFNRDIPGEFAWVKDLSHKEIVDRLHAIGSHACWALAGYLETVEQQAMRDPVDLKCELQADARQRPAMFAHWPNPSERTRDGTDAWVAYHLANLRAIARWLIVDAARGAAATTEED